MPKFALLRLLLLLTLVFGGRLTAALSVRDFGATGDDTTDDTAAIQRALIAAAKAATPQEVRFPGGSYRISQVLVVPGSVVLQGEPGTYLKGGRDHDLLYIHEARRVAIRGISFEGGLRHIKIHPASVDLGSVTITGCTFLEARAFAVECIRLLAPDEDRPLVPYRLESGDPVRAVVQDESKGRLAICPFLLRVERCRFLFCRNALNTTCETTVVADTSVSTDKDMRGGAFRSAGRLELDRISGIAYPSPGLKQHWLTLVDGGAVLRDCTFETRGDWGLCGVYALRTGEAVGTSVVIDNCSFSAFGNEEGCLVYCYQMPNLIAVRNSRELGSRLVDILGFAQPIDLEALRQRRHYSLALLPDRFVLDLQQANQNLVANVPKALASLASSPLPEGTAAAFQTAVHDVPAAPAVLPRRSINPCDFGAKGDGVADDSGALRKAVRKLHADDELVIPSGRYRLTEPVALPAEITIRGEGWPVFLVADPTMPAFVVKKAIGIRLTGCAFVGGESALVVTTVPDREASVQLGDCAFADTSGPAVSCLGGKGRAREPNRSRLRFTGCEFRDCAQVLRTNFAQAHLASCAVLARSDRAGRPVIDSMGPSMIVENLLGIPRLGNSGADADPRWFDAYGRLLCRNVRFGKEDGGMCLVRVRQGERGESEVFIENSWAWCVGNQRRNAMVFCDVLPRTVALRNCVAAPELQYTVRGVEDVSPRLPAVVSASANVFPLKFKDQ